MEKSPKESGALARREFLKNAGVAAGAVGLAAAAGPKKAAAVTPAGAESQGYRETEHVQTYYDLARF